MAFCRSDMNQYSNGSKLRTEGVSDDDMRGAAIRWWTVACGIGLTRMWANAQPDGRPPNINGALCSTPQSLADAHY